jgi:hypothetical protein
MTGLILGIVLPLAWLATGFGAGIRALPRFWHEAYAKWPNAFYESERRGYVKGWFFIMVVCWPVPLLYQGFGALISSRDPQLPERRREELAKQIARLEKEAGL